MIGLAYGPPNGPRSIICPRVYSDEGLCQIVFFESDELCEVSYKDKKGKYQSQQGIVLPKI